MRAIFSVAGLLLVLAVVAVLARNSLSSVQRGAPSAASAGALSASAVSASASAPLPQQITQELEGVVEQSGQQRARALDDAER